MAEAALNIKLVGQDLASAAFRSATNSLSGLTRAISAPIRGIGALQSGLDSAARSAAVSGGILTAGVTAPIAAGFGKAIAKVIDLETNLNVLQAVTSASAAQMKVASDAAIALGADITLPGVTAAKATAAMLELGKAGLSFDNMLAATKGTLQLATAGQLDFAEAASITGRALNAFGLGGDQATRVADLLAAAANASTGSVTDMAYALRQASANAVSAGIPIEQLVAAISLMAQSGITGQDAGTSLKTFFLSLTKNTKPAIAAQKQLGISFVDTAGNIKPLPTIINDLNKAISKLPSGTRQQTLDKIFGQDAGRAALILGREGPAAFEAMLAAVTKQGAASKVASAFTMGLAGAIENLSNTAEAMATEALLPLLPIFAQIVNLGGDVLKFIDNLSPQAKASAAAFVAVVAAAGPLLLIFAGLAGTAAFLLTPFGALVAVLAVMAGKSAQPIKDFEQFKVKFEALIIVVKKLLTGEASLRLLEVAIQNLTGIDVGFLTTLVKGFTFARDAIKTFIGALTGDWGGQTSAEIDPVTKAIGNFGLFIRDTVIPAAKTLAAWLMGPGVAAFQGFAGFIGGTVIPNLQRLADWFQTSILPQLQRFGDFLDSTILPALGRLGDFIGTTVIPKLQEFGAWLQNEGKPLLDAFATVIGVTLLGKLVELGTWLLNDGPAALKSFGDWFKGDGLETIRGFGTLIETIGKLVSDLVGPAFKVLATNAGAIFKELGPLAEAFSGLLELLRPLAAFLGTVFASIAASIPGLLRQLTGFINGLTGSIELVKVLLVGLSEAMGALQRGDVAGAGAALTKAWDAAGVAMKKVALGNQQIVEGSAMAASAQLKVAQAAAGQGSSMNGEPAGAWSEVKPGVVAPPVQNAFTAQNTFGQGVPAQMTPQQFAEINTQMAIMALNMREVNAATATYSATLKNAPADVQTAVTRWMQEI